MCQLLVGLPSVTVLGMVDLLLSVPIVVHVETVIVEQPGVPSCATPATIQELDAWR